MSEKRVVKVFEKDVYGATKMYPANEAGEVFAKIAGTKTLTWETIQLIKELGYEVHRTFPIRGVQV